MKRRFLILLCLCLLPGLAACGMRETDAPVSVQATDAAGNESTLSVRPWFIPLPDGTLADALPVCSAAAASAALLDTVKACALPEADFAAYDNDFFRDYGLLIIHTTEGSAAADYIDAAFLNGAVVITRIGNDPTEDGLRDWLTLLPLPKSELNGVKPETVSVTVRDGEDRSPTSVAEAPAKPPAAEKADPVTTAPAETTAPGRSSQSIPARFVRIYPPEYSSFVQPPVTILRSRAELVRFYEVNRETLGLGSKSPNAVNPAYGQTQPADSTAGFADWMSQYDDAFFADNALILVQTTESSGSHRYREAQFVNGTVRITVEIPEVGTCDMASWITLLPVPQAALAGVRDEAVTVEKQIVNC